MEAAPDTHEAIRTETSSMMTQPIRNTVTGAAIKVALAAMVAIAGAPASADEGVESAHRLRTFDIMLMVTSLRCRSGSDDFRRDYESFAATHLDSLNNAGAVLRRQLGGERSDRALDRMGVRIANSFGEGHPWLECGDLKRMTGELARNPDPEGLARTAAFALGASPALADVEARPTARIAYALGSLMGS